MNRFPNTKDNFIIDWFNRPIVSITIVGNVNLTFKNVQPGTQIMLLVDVDESVNGTVKVSFPENTWTPRGPTFNIQPGLVGVYELACIDADNIILTNDRQVS